MINALQRLLVKENDRHQHLHLFKTAAERTGPLLRSVLILSNNVWHDEDQLDLQHLNKVFVNGSATSENVGQNFITFHTKKHISYFLSLSTANSEIAGML